MALDIQTIDMTGNYVPFERPPQPYTLWSAIPRGLQSFIVDSQALDAKALNDEAFLVMRATLPPNFGYVLADVNMSINQDLAINWTSVCNFNIQNFYRIPVNISVGMIANFVQDFLINSQDAQGRSMSVSQAFPSFPMIGSEGTSGVFIQMSAWNNVAAAAAIGTTNAYMSFWQFDLEQIRKYPINSPQPVHAR